MARYVSCAETLGLVILIAFHGKMVCEFCASSCVAEMCVNSGAVIPCCYERMVAQEVS